MPRTRRKPTMEQQVDFALDHIRTLRRQTRFAGRSATTLEQQITADRHMRALNGFKRIIELHRDQPGLLTDYQTVRVVLDALGFEVPE